MTLEELDIAIREVKTTKELERVGWENMTDEDKAIYIRKAEAFFKGLKFVGCTQLSLQVAPYPRYVNGELIAVNNPEVLRAKASVVYDYITVSTSKRAELIKSGVKSISVSGVSESYKDIVNDISTDYMTYIGAHLFKGVL